MTKLLPLVGGEQGFPEVNNHQLACRAISASAELLVSCTGTENRDEILDSQTSVIANTWLCVE